MLDRLRKFLQPEIEQGLVEVTGTVGQPLVRITGRGMFPSGSATVNPSFKPLLDRIGLALKEEPGSVRVIGYTDDQPIRTIAFPSNFQLSTARAKEAGTIIGASIGDASRLTRGGQGGCRPDRDQLHAGGSRTQQAHRSRAQPARRLAMQALRFLLSRWVLSFVGIAILAVLVWLFGPLIPSFESWVPRLAIVIGLLLTWATSNLSLDLLHRRREQKLESGVAEKAPEKVDDGTGEEAAALRERMSTALTLLKKARGTRGYLYEQPWYAIIGPPGAGKTTALLNSGLKFPLAAEMGQGAVAGVGGTRLCDWWFTENAVLIDTAGRYTTQDSNAAVDRAGWDSFLDLLRRTRPRQPLNGVIVAIALSDIADAPPAERAAHAAAIRRRIKELETRLGIRIPVYALFTKADLIAGFTEFFDDLDRDRRNQVWGVTFPLVKAEAGPVGQFPDELQLLVDSLNDRLFDRLQAEQSPERRVLIAGFPDPDRHPRAAPAKLPHRGLRRLPPRPGAAAARRLSHLRHAGRHPDRSPDRGHGARLRPRPAARGRAAAAAGPQLFPRAPRLRR